MADPVPLVKYRFNGEKLEASNHYYNLSLGLELYVASFADRALAAKDETIAALQSEHAREMEGLAARAMQYENDREYNASLCNDLRAELAAVRQQLADARPIVDAARQLVRDFEAMKARQHELLVHGQTLESASRNWLEHPEAFSKSSLDLQALIDAVATQGAAVD